LTSEKEQKPKYSNILPFPKPVGKKNKKPPD